MKRIYILLVTLFSVAASFSSVYATDATDNIHRIMSCNIRVALEEDEAKGFGWNSRKDICTEIIGSYNPDIICLQEVLRVQYNDIRNVFSDYISFGFEGPEMDAFPEGYHGIAKNVIFFSPKRYEYISSGCYWLSETPHIAGSKSWEAARARHCNWIRLRDRMTNKEFRVLNVHLDHVSQAAKEKQIEMVLEECRQYQKTFPQLLAGDFNSDIKNNVIKSIKSNDWNDTYAAIHGEIETGRTMHSFKGANATQGKLGRIDFIFSYGTIHTIASELVKDNIDGKYPSDHYFIWADIVVGNE